MNINNVFNVIFILIFFLFFSFNVVSAQANLGDAFGDRNLSWPANQMGFDVGAEGESIENIVGIIISSVLSFLGIVFVVLVVYSGFLWMTAEGNDQQVERAKKIMKQSIIGLMVIMFSYGLSWLILNIFINPGTGLPT